MSEAARKFAVVLAAFALLGSANDAVAQDTESEGVLESLGELERRLAERALAGRGLTVVDDSEGRVIDEIFIETVDVLTEDEWLPTWLNVFHWTTQPDIVRERLIIESGDVIAPDTLYEARRQLLDPSLFSTVLVLPVVDDEGSSDAVDVLVVARDVWSLRLNSSFQTTGTALNFLSFSLSENNFLGLNKLVALSFLVEQDTVAFGPTWSDPAVFGSRLTADVAVRFAINHDTGEFEGAFGEFAFGQPLYSLSTPWGWGVEAAFRVLIERAFVGNDLRDYPLDAEDGEATLPWEWRNRALDVIAYGTRSVVEDPEAIQHNLTGGWRVRFSLPETVGSAEGAPQALIDEFRDRALPTERFDSYPYVGYHTFDPDFHQYTNLDTLELLEDVRLGHDVSFQIGVGNPATGSDEAIVMPSAAVGYKTTLFTDDDYAAASVGISSRLERGDWIDIAPSASVRYTSPVLGIGRLTVGALLSMRLRDSQNLYQTLGGDNGLRGYPSAWYLASHILRTNVEYRTLAIELLSMYWGLAAFYDGGDAFDDAELTDFRWKHGVGLGLRWLIPQFNRTVIRIDYGFPLSDLSPLPGSLSAGFEQAF